MFNINLTNLNNLKKDRQRYGLKRHRYLMAWLCGSTYFAVRNYRLCNWLYRHNIKFFPDWLTFRAQHRYGCKISPYAKIGGGLILHHSVGVIVGNKVEIGENCEIFQNVVIGSNRKIKDGRIMPKIGDNCSILTGAVISGPVIIGNNVTIGANAFVCKDVPDNCIVAGVPARIIGYK